VTTGDGSELPPDRPDDGDLKLRGFARESSLGFGRQAASLGLSVIAAVITARALGPVGQGAYTLALLLPYVALALTGLGIARATAYFVGRGDQTVGQALRGTFGLVARVAPFGYLLIGVVIWLRHQLPVDPFVGISDLVLVIGSTMLVLTLLQNSLLAILQGRQRFGSYQVGVLVPQAASVVFLFLVLVPVNLGVLAAVMAAVAGQLLGLAVTLRAVLALLEPQEPIIRWRLDPGYAAAIRPYSLRAYAGSVVNFLSWRSDVFLISLLLGATAPVGLYAIAFQWAERLWFLSNSISVVMLPRIAKLGDAAEETRRRLTPLVARHVLWLSVLPALALGILAPWFVPAFYGEEFAAAVLPLQLLLPGVVLWNVSRILTSDLGGRGRPGLSSMVDAGGLLANVLLNIAWIPPLGIVGAALASTVSYSATTAVKILVYSAVTGVAWWRLLIPERSDIERLMRVARSLPRSRRVAR